MDNTEFKTQLRGVVMGAVANTLLDSLGAAKHAGLTTAEYIEVAEIGMQDVIEFLKAQDQVKSANDHVDTIRKYAPMDYVHEARFKEGWEAQQGVKE